MKKSSKAAGFITVGSQKFPFTTENLTRYGESLIHLTCEAAGIDQAFDGEDFASFFSDLPEVIKEEQMQRMKKASPIKFRVTEEDREIIERRAAEAGTTISDYVRSRALA